MTPILLSFVEYQGAKDLLFSRIKKGMKGDDILETLTCALEQLFKTVDLSCVDFSELDIKLKTCDENQIKVTLCLLFNTLAHELAVTNLNVKNLQTAVNNITTSLSDFKDEKVKASSIDQTAGYLADKIKSDQPDTLILSANGNTLTFHGFVPIGGMIMYQGDSGKFDNTGKGKINTDVWGFAICNGNNGTFALNGSLLGTTTNFSEIGDEAGSNDLTITKNHLPIGNYSASFSGTTSTDGTHSHTYNYPSAKWGSANNGDNKNFNSTEPLTSGNTSTAGAHQHTFSGSVNLVLNPSGTQTKLDITPKHTKLLILKRIF